MLRAVANIPLYLGSFTFATLPAASTATNLTAFASDLGANGSMVQSNGTRWRALNGAAVLKDLGAPVSGIANSNTIVLQTLLPINSWKTNDTIEAEISLAKSGTTDSLTASCYVGTAGTTSDTAIFAGNGLISAANQTVFSKVSMKLVSTTSVQKYGQAGAPYGSQGSATGSAVAISDASANALYVSFAIQSSGTTNTVSIQGGQIRILTP